MSFVEKHKTWLLPLLGVGVAAVGYLNFRTVAPGPVPVALDSAQPLPPARAAEPAPAGPADLWSDLVALAKPPAALVQEGALRDRCRTQLGALLEAPAAPRLLRPGRVREAEPDQVAAPSAAATPKPVPAEPPPVPTVDFILTGPSGAAAWIKGHAYHPGQAIPGGPYRVDAIEGNRVGLASAQGKTTYQTLNHPFANHAGPRLRAEAP